MTLQVVGAGLGRTGTHSLKLALEQLLGAPCYHMFDGYSATVDWPSGSFWKEIASANPDAIILLSTRDSAEAWWKSASDTIFQAIDRSSEGENPFWDMW